MLSDTTSNAADSKRSALLADTASVAVMEGEPFGKYQLIEQIGQGGMGEAWLATLSGAAGFAKTVVIKRLHAGLAERARLAEMLIREAKISSTLQHANIVQIYELGEVEGRHFIAMEYVRGIDLYRLLYRAAVVQAEIREEVCLFIMAEVLRGLDHAHRAHNLSGAPLGLVHHDVSPSNILLGVQGSVKIADFGVARARFSPEFGGGSFGALRGKLGYMSPEQVEAKAVDHRSDLFSAGTCLYELLTRKRLFRGKTDVETLANVRTADVEPRLARHGELSEPVVAILRRALARPRDRRFQTARQFVDAIEAHLFEVQSRVGGRDVAALVKDLLARAVTEPKRSQPTSTGASGLYSRTGSEFTRPGTVSGFGSLHGRPTTLTPGITPSVPTPQLDPSAADGGRRWQRSGRLRETELYIETGPERFVGPVGIDNLRLMVISRSVAPEQNVSIGGGLPLRARDVITRYQTVSDGWPQATVEPTDMALLDRYSVGALLAGYAHDRRLGRLMLVAPDGGTRDVWFSSGRIVRIGTSVEAEHLGPALLEDGTLNTTQLEIATARAGNSDLGLARELVRLGFVTSAVVGRAVSRCLERRYLELFHWTAGRSAYYPGEQPPADGARVDVDPLAHSAAAIRKSFLPEEIQQFFIHLGNPRLRFSVPEGTDLRTLRLPAAELRVLEALRGPALKADELVAAMSADDDERRLVLRVVYLAQQLGLLVAVPRLPDSW